MTTRILVGDCRERLRELEDASVHAVVTDPPYELGFMGRAWDSSGIAYDVGLWREVLRALKPGGHVLAFGGTRTFHRLACAIEDAGFEVRDCLQWIYGSGFPKSLDVSKAIDRRRCDREDVYRVTGWIRKARDAAGITNRRIDEAFGFSGMAGHWTSAASQPAVPTLDQVPQLLEVLGAPEVPEEIRKLLFDLNGEKGQPGTAWHEREPRGESYLVPDAEATRPHFVSHGASPDARREYTPTAPATEAARTWDGWGTALKPANEPIVMARKPFPGTVSANVLAHGCGGINVDASRVGTETVETRHTSCGGSSDDWIGNQATGEVSEHVGRWPSNVLLGCACEGEGHDEECAVAVLDGQSGELQSGALTAGQQERGGFGGSKHVYGNSMRGGTQEFQANRGGASRFFYVAKPSAAERHLGGTNTHPTVKPIELIAYLVRLVTPPGGVVLDPFLGSGTTAIACQRLGFGCVGVELDREHVGICERRLSADAPLFSEVEVA